MYNKRKKEINVATKTETGLNGVAENEIKKISRIKKQTTLLTPAVECTVLTRR